MPGDGMTEARQDPALAKAVRRFKNRRRRGNRSSPDERRSGAPPMNQAPRPRWDRQFVRAAGFLVTVLVQIISRIHQPSSECLMTIPPPVIDGIPDEVQQRWGD